eukprot:NODE_78_length_2451_cov_91.957831_g57_i0.p1 GENE.NODE_78_length_2451_cov_91.957831_g57_i0~~NODE_78_length_2451_cov_91.957831_g57_i0.p1  ORF type:complete len:605 (+),score=55.77 NODE_78_length_2451_cov_91.957831_g57_i0:593-2407(+)
MPVFGAPVPDLKMGTSSAVSVNNQPTLDHVDEDKTASQEPKVKLRRRSNVKVTNSEFLLGSPRQQIELFVVIMSMLWLAVRLLEIHAYHSLCWFSLVSLLSSGMRLLFSCNQSLTFLSSAKYYRAEQDSGLLHGATLAPLVLGAKFVEAQSTYPMLAPYAEYMFVASCLCGIVSISVCLAQPSLDRNILSVAGPLLMAISAGATWSLKGSLVMGLHLMFTVLVFVTTLHLVVGLFQKSFTLGEAAIMTFLFSFLCSDTLALCLDKIGLSLFLPTVSVEISRSYVYVLLNSLILGMLMISVFLAPILYKVFKTQREPASPKNQQKVWMLALAFYAGAAFIVFAIYGPIVQLFMPENPFLWTLNFLVEHPARLLLSAYWVLGVVLAIVGLTQLSKHSAGFRSIPLIVVRKFFHLLAVLLFLPACLLEPQFLQLSFGVALAIFILAEYIRFFKLPPIGSQMHWFMSGFLDHRDTGPIILSHTYLLLGCALPLWLAGTPEQDFFTGFSGVLMLGIGDTMASIIGIAYGHNKWPQTSKSLQGTIAAVTSVCLFVAGVHSVAASYVGALNLPLYFLAICIGGILEAVTLQNDNLLVPLYLYALTTLILPQ